MDHEAFENQMFDCVNRNAEEKSQYYSDNATEQKSRFVSVKNAKTLGRGIARLLFALLTALLFAIAVYGFVVVAHVTGYWAVLLFTVSVVNLFWAFVLVYAQGRARKTNAESKGDGK